MRSHEDGAGAAAGDKGGDGLAGGDSEEGASADSEEGASAEPRDPGGDSEGGDGCAGVAACGSIFD